MLRREIFMELRQLDNLIQNATTTYDGDTFSYKDNCARWENECFENDILNLDALMDDVIRNLYYNRNSTNLCFNLCRSNRVS